MNNKDYVFKSQTYSIDIEYLEKNMLALEIYWKNLEYTLIEESPTTTDLDLISNIGGLLGLFLGNIKSFSNMMLATINLF